MARDTTGTGLLTSPVRRDIMDTLLGLPTGPEATEPATLELGLTAAELAERLGLHVTTIRFHVDQMVAADLLQAIDVRRGVGRPRRHYAISPGRLVDVDGPDSYRILSEVLAEAMSDLQVPGIMIAPEEAGERWVHRHISEFARSDLSRDPADTTDQLLAKLGVIVDLLQRWGYQPTVTMARGGRLTEIDLAACPLLELAGRIPTVTCGVHTGILRAALKELGEEPAITLSPRAPSGRCKVELRWDDEGRPSRA